MRLKPVRCYKVGKVVIRDPKTVKTADSQLAALRHKREEMCCAPYPTGLTRVESARYEKRHHVRLCQLDEQISQFECAREKLLKQSQAVVKRIAKKKKSDVKRRV